ncbi:fungal-specific transcription factor domain-containing protein [Mycena crocata]|nr:fungal-specific transcription factor domain-containing protein [Mycena crocata]
MSSNEDNDSAAKKRKGHRPCDMCRRKKRRCDGGDPCGHCIQHEFSCTYQQRAMQRTTAPSSSYVQSLENRLKTVEAMLRESMTITSGGSDSSPGESSPTAATVSKVVGPGIQLITSAIRGLNSPVPAPHPDDLTFAKVSESLHSLSLDNPGDHGFQGKSSQAMLVKAAVELRSSHTRPSARNRMPPPAKPWTTKPWARPPPRRNFDFPPLDLMLSLIALYFAHVNSFFPLLHQPTFEGSFASRRYLHDDSFAEVLLLVCALGARYTDDPRVQPTGSAAACGMAGWAWFDQVRLAGHSLAGQPTLGDLQCYCLAVQFLDRVSGARACWTLVGFGIRLGQDIGAHRIRRRPGAGTITQEEELEKRAYWIMILFDTQLSAALGRSIAIQSHDFDLDLPILVDDQYWDPRNGGAAFTQPPDMPSRVGFFTCQLTLNRILSFTLKILYSTNRTKSLIGMNEEYWEQKVVVELDSALNTWLDSVPAHLRWDPTRTDDLFFDQSAALYCSYYLAQILVHRPFIPAVRRTDSASKFPSLTICNNAARACSHVADTQQRRRPDNPLVFGHTAVFTAGIVLLINIWGANRTGQVPDDDLSDVHRCMRVLRAYKARWPSAGPLLDTLEQLLKVDHGRSHRDPDGDFEPSPFVGSAPAPAPAVLNNPTAGPSAHAQGWPEYDPRLESVLDPSDLAFMDHVIGAAEAPARIPHTPGANDTMNGGGTFPANPPNGLGMQAYNNAAIPADNDMNLDTVAFWSAAPSGFEVSDWDMFLSNMDVGEVPEDPRQVGNGHGIAAAWI